MIDRIRYIVENFYYGFLRYICEDTVDRWYSFRRDIRFKQSIEYTKSHANLPPKLAEWYADKPHQVLRMMMMRLDDVDPDFRKFYEKYDEVVEELSKS